MTNTVTRLADQLLASYQQQGGINHVDGKNLPSQNAVVAITTDLLRLLFPGFFDDKPLHSSELQWETTVLVHKVLGRLEEEIYKSLEYLPPEGARKKDLRPLARQCAEELLAGLPCLREILQTDVEAAYNGDPAALSREEVIVAYPFVEAIAVHRLAHELYRRRIALIPRIMSEWAHSRTGMDIHPGATIGSHFFVDHCTGTVIGETSVLGHHVKLYQGVALIARSLSGGQQLRGVKRHPTLQDRVTVYAGATIMGGDTVVGEGSTIGANVFLSHSVPPRSLVVMEDVKVRVLNKEARHSVDFQI
ncbi:MAG: serine O-acetyltransferase [Verrucomicrobiae bacterium]|nr:serine O-acetyltransferase [Verrucomicrobiae bacterium]